jgi:hypothetical protein
MENLITLYCKEIINGNITIDDVPAKLKEKIQAELDKAIVGD